MPSYLKGDLVKLNPPGLEVRLNSPLVSYAIQALMDGNGEIVADSHSSGTNTMLLPAHVAQQRHSR